MRKLGTCKLLHDQATQEQSQATDTDQAKKLLEQQSQEEPSNPDKNRISGGQISLIIGIVIIALVGSTAWCF